MPSCSKRSKAVRTICFGCDEGGAFAHVLQALLIRVGAPIVIQVIQVQSRVLSSSDDETSTMANVLAIQTYLVVRSGHAFSRRHTWHHLIGIKGCCNVGDLDEIRHNNHSMHITYWHHTSSAIKSASLLPKYQL
jgi:hypothetical protein